MLQFSDPFAAAVASVNPQVDLTLALAAGSALCAQLFEPGDPTNGAGSAGFDALTDPDFFLRQQLVGSGIGQRLLVEHLLFALEVGLPAAGKAGDMSTIKLDNAGRNALQKAAVVRDEQQRATGPE
jgi:hypothetical protein